MTTSSILLVGSYIVPLVALAIFAILYFLRYRQYLFDKNGYVSCQFLEDAWKGYIFARLAYHKHLLGSKFWWYFFGTKYVNLVNYFCERCIYELDQLDRFEGPYDNRPCFHRKAFMRHWQEIHTMLFDAGYHAHGYSGKDNQYKFRSEFGEDPFGWMTVMIESKLFELYKKHAMQLLRTKGYYVFSKFLLTHYDKSQSYPHNAAFSIIASGKFHEKIMWDNAQEIGERIQHEIKVILGTNKIPKTEIQVKDLQSLTKTFVLSKGYDGTAYPGISEARLEIYKLLEKVTVPA